MIPKLPQGQPRGHTNSVRKGARGDVVVEKLANLALNTVHVVKNAQFLITPPIKRSTYPPHFAIMEQCKNG